MPRATTFASNSARGEGLFMGSVGGPTWVNTLVTATNPYNKGIKTTIDSSGNVYVVGFAATATTTITGGYGFITKYDLNGALQWSRQIGSGSQSVCVDVATDSSNNVYVVGSYSGTSYQAGFVAKFNTSGTWQWQNIVSSSIYNQHIFAITIDSLNNVYIGGGTTDNGFVAQISTSGTMNWHSDSSYPPATLCNYGGNIFAASIADEESELMLYSLTSAGIKNWVIAFDFYNSNYSASGYYNFPYGNTSLSSPANIVNLRSSTSAYGKIYIALGMGLGCFDASSGSITWFKKLGNLSNYASIYDVSADSIGNVYFTGTYNGTSGTEIIGRVTSSGTPFWANTISSLTSGTNVTGYGIYTDGNYVVTTGNYTNSSYVPEVFSGKFPLDGSKTFSNVLNFSSSTLAITATGISPYTTEGGYEYDIVNATTGSASYYTVGTDTSSSITFTSTTKSI